MKIAPDMDLGLLADRMGVDDELAAEYMRHMLVKKGLADTVQVTQALWDHLVACSIRDADGDRWERQQERLMKGGA